MNKLLVTALVTGILFFMPAAEAAIETYVGEGKATMSEDETQEKTINRAKNYALRHAQEQAGVYIRSQSRMQDLELVDDDVETITGGIVKIINTNVEKTLSGDVIQVHVTVTVQIDTDDLQREIDRYLNKRPKQKEEPKPPIDRPKPLDQPKPPVEQPKPPVEQPKPPVPTVKPPVEQPKPPAPTVEPPAPTVEPPKVETPPIEKIEPPTPVEPVTPSGTWLSDEQIMTSDLLEAINAEREKSGKKPLTRNSVLAKGAKTRAEELVRQWSHKRPNGQNWVTVLPASFQSKSSWEYIHSGYDTAQKVINWYMSQSDNKILSSNYQNIGIGYVYKPDSTEKHFWVVILN